MIASLAHDVPPVPRSTQFTDQDAIELRNVVTDGPINSHEDNIDIVKAWLADNEDTFPCKAEAVVMLLHRLRNA